MLKFSIFYWKSPRCWENRRQQREIIYFKILLFTLLSAQVWLNNRLLYYASSTLPNERECTEDFVVASAENFKEVHQ